MLLFSGIFFIIWGSMFAGGPLFMFVSSIINGSFQFTNLFFLAFIAVGCFVFSMGVKNIIKFVKLKAIKYFGKKTMATYFSSEEDPKPNNFSFAIIVTFKDKAGNTIQRKTDYKYSTEDVEYFIEKKTFPIKYNNRGNIIITDEPNPFRQLYKTISDNTIGQSPQVIKQTQYYCVYCNGKQTSPGKCKNCGANVREKRM